MKQLRFGLFENAQANDSGTATWRHPLNERDHFDSLDYWRHIAEISEKAGLDFIFLADAWGWSEVNGSRPEICTEESLDLPRLDPAMVASAIIAETQDLGVVITGSTLLEQPYAFARRMATLDHLSGGRLGWNVVTTGTAETAVKAFGAEMVAHDERYNMADDFMDVVYKLWEGCWEPDALERDKSGRFADPAKVHPIEHSGPYFRSSGFGSTSYSPQGTPVLFQAGTSERGRQFGGLHGECIFMGGSSAEKMAKQVAAVRAEAVDNGRDANDVKIMAAFSCVIGDTEEDARKKFDEILAAQDPRVAVASYAMFTGLDLSSYSPDTPMTELSTEMSQTQISRFEGLTVGDVLADWHAFGVRGKPIIGSAEQVADEIIERAETADLDGYLITPIVQPMSTVDFVEKVLPILRARGVARDGYHESTLRERLVGTDSSVLPDVHPAAKHRAHAAQLV